MEYTKLSALIDSSFTIQDFNGITWKKWDNENRKMLMSKTFEQGYRKLYTFVTDKGTLDLGSGQVGELLIKLFDEKMAGLKNRTFLVESNGKSGMDVRYFFKLKK